MKQEKPRLPVLLMTISYTCGALVLTEDLETAQLLTKWFQNYLKSSERCRLNRSFKVLIHLLLSLRTRRYLAGARQKTENLDFLFLKVRIMSCPEKLSRLKIMTSTKLRPDHFIQFVLLQTVISTQWEIQKMENLESQSLKVALMTLIYQKK